MLPWLGRLLQGPASAGLLLMLLALPPAAPSCPALCTCYSSPPTVSCQANNFSSVPLSLPPNTQRLFLQNNLIRTLRPGTFGPNLLTLWLFSNNLSAIYPGTFRHLQALEELDLGDNRHLRSLEPDTFQGLERLQSLHLYRCQLSSLPSNIFRGLVSLQYLYLQENSLLHLQVSDEVDSGNDNGSTNLTSLHRAPTMGWALRRQQGTKQIELPAFRENILVGETDQQKTAEYAGKSCHGDYYFYRDLPAEDPRGRQGGDAPTEDDYWGGYGGEDRRGEQTCPGAACQAPPDSRGPALSAGLPSPLLCLLLLAPHHL
ncbi:reticulon-4 receptor-like 2 [Suricata suricatta]|uniref:reticulon-4 receptor-like 2 n=1 Tax=Suricata suricatta TaxID=37032 RepID=UPI001156814C|nr:reticulon-4 receptor-like 2 [Suricata suricatta]